MASSLETPPPIETVGPKAKEKRGKNKERRLVME